MIKKLLGVTGVTESLGIEMNFFKLSALIGRKAEYLS